MGLSMVEVRPARLDQPMQVLFFQDAKVVEILWLETAEEPPHTEFALGMRNRVSVHGLHARVVRGPGGGAPMVAPIDGKRYSTPQLCRRRNPSLSDEETLSLGKESGQTAGEGRRQSRTRKGEGSAVRSG